METNTRTELSGIDPTTDAPSRLRAVLFAIGVTVGAALYVPLVVGSATELWALLGNDSFLVPFAVGGTLATLSLGAMAYYYVRYTSLAVPVRLPTRRDLAWVVVGIVVPLAIQIGLIVVGSRFGVQPVGGGIDAAAAADPVLVYSLALVSALFLIGPVEELLYRGVVQARLRQSFGPVAAIGLTSLGFAAGHVATLVWGGGDPFTLGFGLSLLAIASGSVVLGVVYERTANLVPAILAHSLFNGLLLALALATVL
jgi:membrane protease YdiL (CAAX protease family)